MSEHFAEGDLLTIPQVLAIVPLGRSTLYKLVETGKLPHYRVSAAGSRRGRILIARADLEEFIASSRQAATRTPVRVDPIGRAGARPALGGSLADAGQH